VAEGFVLQARVPERRGAKRFSRRRRAWQEIWRECLIEGRPLVDISTSGEEDLQAADTAAHAAPVKLVCCGRPGAEKQL